MTYEEGKNEIVYTGDVTIRQGDIQTTSPQATLKLAAGGNSIDTLEAVGQSPGWCRRQPFGRTFETWTVTRTAVREALSN
jgi:hypothetical protein